MQADPQLLQILGAAGRCGVEEVHHLGVSCVLLRGNQRDGVLTTNPCSSRDMLPTIGAWSVSLLCCARSLCWGTGELRIPALLKGQVCHHKGLVDKCLDCWGELLAVSCRAAKKSHRRAIIFHALQFWYVPQTLLLRPPECAHCSCNRSDFLHSSICSKKIQFVTS